MLSIYLFNCGRNSDSWPDGVHPGDIDVSTKSEVRGGAEQGCGGAAKVVQHGPGHYHPSQALVRIGPDSNLLSRDQLALKIIWP